MSIADNPIFHDANAARDWLESLLWPEGPICPHCGLVGAAYKLNGKGGAKGKAQRPGLYKCKGCEEQFTVTVGTVFERSHTSALSMSPTSMPRRCARSSTSISTASRI